MNGRKIISQNAAPKRIFYNEFTSNHLLRNKKKSGVVIAMAFAAATPGSTTASRIYLGITVKG